MGVGFKDSFVRIDFMGEAAVRWSRFDRHVRFLQALAQANMMRRLSSEDGQGWIRGQELTALPGLKSDKFDRAAQLRAMSALGLIKPNPHDTGMTSSFWLNVGFQIGDVGLEIIQLVKDGAQYVLITESGHTRALDMDSRW
jgi:hypothetical protein